MDFQKYFFPEIREIPEPQSCQSNTPILRKLQNELSIDIDFIRACRK